MNIKKEPLFWALDLEMEQPSNEIISIGIAWETPYSAVPLSKNFLITPSYPLSSFIQELTGLQDSMFDATMTRKECFQSFYEFWLSMTSENRNEHHRLESHPITWGQGDLHLLRKQMCAELDEVNLPKRIVDVKTLMWFDKMAKGNYNSARMSLSTALKEMKIPFLGDAHNSADDALNTLVLFRRLLEQKQNLRSHLKIISDLS